jgi:hypothetical protein
MITSLEEAMKHANHSKLTVYKYVVVLPDGSIHASNDAYELSNIVTSESFVVKGEIKSYTVKVPKAIKKEKESKETQE